MTGKDAGSESMLLDIEGGEEGDEVIIERDTDYECEPIRMAADPGKPTDRQIEEHRLTHVPYKSWCPECVEGRGLREQRGRHAGRTHEIPVVGIDYFFIAKGGILTKDEVLQKYDDETEGDVQLENDRKEGKIVKCIVIRCFRTKTILGHVVPQKGEVENSYTVGLIVQALQWLGHTRLIIKNYNGPAIQAVARNAVELAKVRLEVAEQV